MSDKLTHECGIALIRLLKPLEYYKEKYGTTFYGLNKMYLMLEKQHNRGQDGAGLANIKFDVEPGQRYISRVRSNTSQPIQDVFTQINQRINKILKDNPDIIDNVAAQKKRIPALGELYLGHVRSATSATKSIEHMHPFLRQNNWMHRNLLIAGNFSMTNTDQMFANLLRLGMHPKENADAVTVLEKIGHFLDDEVNKLYKKAKKIGLNKQEASPYIVDKLKIGKILKRSSKDWDGGYVIGGMFGHGDSFVLRDPAGIRPAYYYVDEEVIAVASERSTLQTVFNIQFKDVQEIQPGHALLIKKNGQYRQKRILKPLPKRACSFERIYFSRGNDAEIYEERKALGRMVMPEVLKTIDYDTENAVFSYIPNTAETSFIGMLEAAQDELNKQKNEAILKEKSNLTTERLEEIQSIKIRAENIAVKDVKLRTFITEDESRADLIAHVYDVTYGVVKPTDNLVIIDDSIVRGATLRQSILNMLSRLKPKQIVVVSSAPQIRYPDCYGINMPNLEELIAFQATLQLHKENHSESIIQKTYDACLEQLTLTDKEMHNAVLPFYDAFSYEQVSDAIANLICNETLGIPLKVIYQTVENLNKACPKNLGDWYFTGNYPTPGGYRIVNQAFVNFYEKHYSQKI